MSIKEKVKPGSCALLLIDLQNDFCHPNGTSSKNGRNLYYVHRMFPCLTELLQNARENKLDIIHVRTIHTVWTDSLVWQERWGNSPNRMYTRQNTWGADFIEEFKPINNELIVEKHRYSAFVNTKLDSVLRSKKKESLIITGVFTNLCVDCTIRDAFMRDYFVVVPGDCVACESEEEQMNSLKIFEYAFANVVTKDEIIKIWSSGK